MMFCKIFSEKYPESFDASVPESLVYSGSKKLTETFGDSLLDIGKLILSPTRTYTPIIKKILRKIDPRFTVWFTVVAEHKLKFYIL